MPITREGYFFDKKITRSAAGFDDAKSMVLRSSKVDAIASGPGTGRYIVEAGTVMVWDDGDSKERIKPLHMNAGEGTGGSGAYVAGDIVGILHAGIELGGQGDDYDMPVSILHHGVNFSVEDLVGYTGNETIVKAALPTCIFTDVSGLVTHVSDL
jgi:hypothetical protein